MMFKRALVSARTRDMDSIAKSCETFRKSWDKFAHIKILYYLCSENIPRT